MRQIGVRELKQNASQVLTRVKAGETVEVTERGTAVALLSPYEAVSSYERLVDSGDVLAGGQGVLDIEPVIMSTGIRLSDDLAALRDEDWR
ncbi:type II toxin-antitoxin system prevent-host-death family antitoxin [Frankia sp. Cr2]|uniref:type II toxin-antitoxin system Phd/YefM family antitoxin n=1 Tax=Frankia sp. Cr2 TaxID=3073932 RepID=UPI002AD46695|nr:type II toxin-antitoxin system prevent-host-death family antitoxin [Frankia sp. Cr2]